MNTARLIPAQRALVLFTQAAIVLGALAAWQFFPDFFADEFLISRPALIAGQAAAWLADGTLAEAAFDTLKVVLLGLLAGAAAGIALGAAAALAKSVENLVEPLVKIFFAMPKVALVPLFILWFGVGDVQHIFFTAVVVFFFFFFAIFNGVRGVPRELVNAMLLAGASARQRLFLLYLPASFGWILSGLRLAIPYAFVSAISAEIIASSDGLGHLAKASAGAFNAAGVFAAILTLLVLSVAISSAALALGRNSRWNV
jgi:NitT/TauT family transport system permease protein